MALLALRSNRWFKRKKQKCWNISYWKPNKQWRAKKRVVSWYSPCCLCSHTNHCLLIHFHRWLQSYPLQIDCLCSRYRLHLSFDLSRTNYRLLHGIPPKWSALEYGDSYDWDRCWWHICHRKLNWLDFFRFAPFWTSFESSQPLGTSNHDYFSY